ncbi:RICIN domain-containing protein [Streptomyces gamaensis]|uniref:RICIN domain-containing protein n=1 Tax=Streptomyces gamaensis TaxID=1763542 RepID=A0ABW0Z1N9_9ACTN
MEQKRLKSVLKLNDAQSTGLHLRSNMRTAVEVADTPDSRAGKMKLRIGVPGSQNQQVITLKPGIQSFIVRGGGMVYVSVEGDSSSGNTDVQFMGRAFTKAPRFVLGETRVDEFRKMLDERTDIPWVEYVSGRTILTVDRATALKFRDQNPNWLMESYDRLVGVQDSVNNVGEGSGQIAPSPLVQHIVLDGQKKKGVAQVADGYAAFDAAYADILLTPNKLTPSGIGLDPRDDRAWEVWRELGRHRQLAPVSGDGLGEAMSTLYATAAERAFEHPWAGIGRELDSNLAKMLKANPSSPDVQRAVMLDQLVLAYGEDFWPKVNKLLIEDKPRAQRTAQDYLIATASLFAKEDLRDFFAKYGLIAGDFANKSVDSLGLPKPKTDPSTLGNGRPQQSATVAPLSNGTVTNVNSKLCLEVDNSSKSDGARVQQWDCKGQRGANWSTQDAGDGYVHIVNKNSGKVLEIENSSRSNGARAQQWANRGQNGAKWRITSSARGLLLQNKASGKILEIDNSSRANGATAQQWDDKGQRGGYWQK